MNIGFGEIIVILLVVLVILARKLPEIGKSMGRAVTEFKKGVKDIKDEESGEKDK